MWKVTTTSKTDGPGEFTFTDSQTKELILTGIADHTEGTVTIEYIDEEEHND